MDNDAFARCDLLFLLAVWSESCNPAEGSKYDLEMANILLFLLLISLPFALPWPRLFCSVPFGKSS